MFTQDSLRLKWTFINPAFLAYIPKRCLMDELAVIRKLYSLVCFSKTLAL